MKILFGACLMFAASTLLAEEKLSDREAARIADAIYVIEGGVKAKVPYGILSVRVRDESQARQVCLNTIKNTHQRWIKAGRKGEFLHYLANRYCPPVDSPGNRNWKRNIKLVLKKQSVQPVRVAGF
jgi:hypothetical protein